ncbi:hypothetical protein [Mycetohabitans endofungorum]|uniref:hypothetical protein n=1 Tax=Mycetohabitans endofungorum TaxID=417203 RepID=UPI0030D2F3D9
MDSLLAKSGRQMDDPLPFNALLACGCRSLKGVNHCQRQKMMADALQSFNAALSVAIT